MIIVSKKKKMKKEKEYPCENCRMKRKAEEKPGSFMARFWRWHTRWCPGWKAYQRHLNEQAGSL
jgi:hypothetical protein